MEKLSLKTISIEEGVSVRTVRYWIATGKLPAEKTLGGHWRVKRSDLEAARPRE